MVVLEREVFAVFTEDSIPQRLPVSRPSFLLVEVFMKVFKVEDRSEVLRTRLRIGSMEISTRRCMAEAERQIEARLSERLEQSHPGAWAVAPDPQGQTYFWHRRSRRVRWTLPPGASCS